MQPTKEWLEKWEKVKDKLQPSSNLEDYFTLKEIAGKELDVMDIGPCSIPTGEFRTELAVIKASDGDCDRYAAARLKFNDNKIAYYEEAMIGQEELNDIKKGDYFGFSVDAGLACFCDKKLHDLFCDFAEKWVEENPDGNAYDDYFADFFKKSYENNPKYQRDAGDWINWTIPGTDYHLPMFQSGFGDGTYPTYIAYDKDNNPCQLIIEFIDIELAYGKNNK